MRSKHLLSALTVSALAGVACAANPVLVDSGGTGQFTSVQAAISSYTTGGANAGETAPFVIKIKAGSGPYDEAITLDPSVAGQGDIVGDIAIESDTSGTKVILKLQKTASTGAADDGLFINQNQHDVTFRDIVFTRSISTPENMPTDELVRVDESAANTDMNLISFYNCVFTEVDAAGNPMTTDKAGALVPPGTRGGPARIAGARLLQFWGDAGESNQLILDNCVFYFGTSTNVTARNDGAGAEFIQINNSLSTWAGFDCWNVGGSNAAAVLTISGTDQTAGPLNCTAGINPLVGGHCFTIAGTATGHTSNINGIIAYSEGTASTPAGTNASRGVSGGRSNLTLENAIINVPNYGVVDVTEVPSTWNNVTILNPTAAYLGVEGAAGVPAAGSLLVTNSIISGAGTKFNGLNATGLPAGGITVTNSALVTEGPHAIGAAGTVTEVNVINADPQYASLDGTVEPFMDVQNSAYATAGVAGAPLAGGADYIGGSSVSDWSVY